MDASEILAISPYISVFLLTLYSLLKKNWKAFRIGFFSILICVIFLFGAIYIYKNIDNYLWNWGSVFFTLYFIPLSFKIYKILKTEPTKTIELLPMKDLTKICITCVICSFIISIGISLSNRYIITSTANNDSPTLYVLDNITGKLKSYNRYAKEIINQNKEAFLEKTQYNSLQNKVHIKTYFDNTCEKERPINLTIKNNSDKKILGTIFYLYITEKDRSGSLIEGTTVFDENMGKPVIIDAIIPIQFEQKFCIPLPPLKKKIDNLEKISIYNYHADYSFEGINYSGSTQLIGLSSKLKNNSQKADWRDYQ